MRAILLYFMYSQLNEAARIDKALAAS